MLPRPPGRRWSRRSAASTHSPWCARRGTTPCLTGPWDSASSTTSPSPRPGRSARSIVSPSWTGTCTTATGRRWRSTPLTGCSTARSTRWGSSRGPAGRRSRDQARASGIPSTRLSSQARPAPTMPWSSGGSFFPRSGGSSPTSLWSRRGRMRRSTTRSARCSFAPMTSVS